MGSLLEAREMRITKEDWHQEWCDEQCDKHFCESHRSIYYGCQSATNVADWDDYGKFLTFDNEGHCLHCISDLAKERLAEMEEHKLQISKAA